MKAPFHLHFRIYVTLVYRPARGEEQPHTPVWLEADQLQSSFAEDFGIQSGHLIAHEPATFICNEDDQQSPGLHKHWEQVKGRDPSPILSPGETYLQWCD